VTNPETSTQATSKRSQKELARIAKLLGDRRKVKYTCWQRVKRISVETWVAGLIVSGAIVLLSVGLWQVVVGIAATIHVIWFFRNRYIGNRLIGFSALLEDGVTWAESQDMAYARDESAKFYLAECSQVWYHIARPFFEMDIDLKRLKRLRLYNDPFNVLGQCRIWLMIIDASDTSANYLLRYATVQKEEIFSMAKKLKEEASRITN